MNQVNKEVTIYDIAEKLNVSATTVSRALKKSKKINPATREKIEAAADMAAYRRNDFATSLSATTTKTIGVIVPTFFSSFISAVLAGIEKIATAKGYAILVAQSGESLEKEASNALNLFHRRVDGLIVSLAHTSKELKHFQPFKQRKIPVVFIDRVSDTCQGTKIVIDNYNCGYQATQHLISQGCQKIAHVTGDLSKSVYQQRYRGFVDALSNSNLTHVPEELVETSLGGHTANEIAGQLLSLDPRPDGVFFANDYTAILCMKVLLAKGVSIPTDMAIIGFNNDPLCTVIQPSLSSINYPGSQLGEIAATNLLLQLDGESTSSAVDTITIPAELIIRQSSMKSQCCLTS